MSSFYIVQKTNHDSLYAICSSKESAERWLASYNPKMWMDKTVTVDQLEIIVRK